MKLQTVTRDLSCFSLVFSALDSGRIEAIPIRTSRLQKRKSLAESVPLRRQTSADHTTHQKAPIPNLSRQRGNSRLIATTLAVSFSARFESRLAADDAAARAAKARNCSLEQYRAAAEPRARLQLLYAQANLGLVPVGFGGPLLARARAQMPMSDALRARGFWCTAQAGRDRNIAHHLLTALPHGIVSTKFLALLIAF